MLNNSYVMLEQNGFGEWLCTPKMPLHRSFDHLRLVSHQSSFTWHLRVRDTVWRTMAKWQQLMPEGTSGAPSHSETPASNAIQDTSWHQHGCSKPNSCPESREVTEAAAERTPAERVHAVSELQQCAEGEAVRLHSTQGLQHKTIKWKQVSTKGSNHQL